MLDKLEIFRMAGAMAQHAGARQAVVARNIAHADTPGYRAQTVEDFAETYRANTAGQALRATRAGHLHGTDTAAAPETTHSPAVTESPNGNTVSLESEMMRATDIRHQHDMALTVYQTSIDILRSSLGRR